MEIRALVVIALVFLSGVAPSAEKNARSVLESSAKSMGGVAALQSIKSITYTAVGERDMVEQSERPSGPYFIDHFRERQTRDLVNHRVKIERTSEAYAADKWWLQEPDATPRVTVINDDVAAIEGKDGPQYGGGSLIAQNDEQFAFAPERLILTALSAPGLRLRRDVVLHGVPHHVITFRWREVPCTLYINAQSGLPWRLDFVRAYPSQTFLNVWGDVPTTIVYNAWTLEPGGIVYPREWTITRLGLPDTHTVIIRLAFNQKLDEPSLAVPPAMFQAHHGRLRRVDSIALGFGGSRSPYALARGIVQYPGGWNVAFVRQKDGVVLIEAPWSPNYTQRAIDAAQRMFNARVNAVVTTSDSWPHIAGVRQAVADRIPVYALDLNGPILRRLIAAPHRMDPDDLQKHPRHADLRLVSRPMQLGDGPNRLILVPYRTATAERQMMVYFPDHRLLYTSDLFAPDGDDSWFTPEYLHEALTAIAREHLSPTTVFGMHYGSTPFSQIIKGAQPPANN